MTENRKEKWKLYMREYRKKNKEDIAYTQHKNYMEHREERIQYAKDYRKRGEKRA